LKSLVGKGAATRFSQIFHRFPSSRCQLKDYRVYNSPPSSSFPPFDEAIESVTQDADLSLKVLSLFSPPPFFFFPSKPDWQDVASAYEIDASSSGVPPLNSSSPFSFPFSACRRIYSGRTRVDCIISPLSPFLPLVPFPLYI